MDWSSFGLLVSETRPAIPGAGPQRVADVLDAGSPAGEALVGSRGRYTYAELDAAADRAAHALAALGLAPGDRIAVCLPNDVDIVVAFLGAMRLGAVWVGVNRALAPPEKQYLLSDSGASVFLATAEAAAQLRPHTDGLSALRHVVVIERESGPDEWSPRLSAAPGIHGGVMRSMLSNLQRLRTPAVRRAGPRVPSTASTTCCCRDPFRATRDVIHRECGKGWFYPSQS